MPFLADSHNFEAQRTLLVRTFVALCDVRFDSASPNASRVPTREALVRIELQTEDA
jgi:hypothetical protein